MSPPWTRTLAGKVSMSGIGASDEDQKPARCRQLFRKLKFHRLLHRVEGTMGKGYFFRIDGPLSLFSATNKYRFQMALFLPALLRCDHFRLDAGLRWGPKRIPLGFHLENKDGIVPIDQDAGTYVPAEISAFLERFHQVAARWEVSEATDFVELGREGVWFPIFGSSTNGRASTCSSKSSVFGSGRAWNG